jgi:pimeloyl-ACP methyl ester carboxylesterase
MDSEGDKVDFDYASMPAIILGIGISTIWLSLRRILSLSAKVQRKGRRIIERIVLSLAIVLAAAVTASTTLNAIAIWFLRPHDRPAGSIYLVNGYKMHIDCTGSGSPALVLESGLGNESLIWSKVQPAISRTTRVCSYDRAGYGYSDAQPAPRDADRIAIELHSLLLQAKVSGPIILMGHSLGGLFIRDYATRYPEQVAGLIFVDASTPLQGRNPASRIGKPQGITRLVTKLAFVTNPSRLLGACSVSLADSDPPGWKLAAEDLCHPQFAALDAESDSFERSSEETVNTGPYGALPVLIFSHDLTRTKRDVNWENAWSQMQENLKELSTRSRRIVAKDSTHMVQLDRADLINKETALFIEQIRRTVPLPTNYGSTMTE